jgi:hypothetical protein
MLGLPGHNEVMRLEDVLLLLKGGQLRPTDLVKKLGEPWRAANEVPELMEYFTDPKKAAGISDAASLGLRTGPRDAGRSPTVHSVPRTSAPPPTRGPEATPRPAAPPRPVEKRSLPPSATPPPPPLVKSSAPASAPAAASKSETRPPEATSSIKAEGAKSETKPPPGAETRSEASKAETKAPAAAVADASKPAEEKPRGLRTRPLPKPPPPPKLLLEPMVGKYFGPVDLLRSASFAFEPKKLLLTAIGVTPLVILAGMLWHLSADRDSVREWAFAILSGSLWIFGFAFIWMALAYLTRRQLEGQAYAVREVLGFAKSNIVTAVLYPVVALIPSVLSVIVLWIFRLIRNGGPGGASFVKVAYLLPMAFGFLAVAGILILQLASMFVPAAAAIEGQGLMGAVNAAWNHVRRQWGRVVLHWLIVTVAVGVITVISLWMAASAMDLPQRIFGRIEDFRILEAWSNFSDLFAIYAWLAVGLGLVLPVSLLSTLGALSYVSLRHPGSAQLSPAPPDETGDDGMTSTPTGSSHPGEATQPSETRPAPTEPGGPGATPPASEISDDSDEQPLVKES